MPVSEAQRAFGEAAAADGVVLVPGSFPWLTEQGHVALDRLASGSDDAELVERVRAVTGVLAAIFTRVGGDRDVLPFARISALPVDFVHEPTGTLIEIDEPYHFTSHRLAALDLYPDDVPLGFDREAHKELCRELSATADLHQRGLAARAFGFGGVPRERAYHDALRDLATPAMGHPPLVRIAVGDEEDGAAAYRRHRDALASLLPSSS